MSARAECRFSPAAEQDLQGIWQYTEENWGRKQADAYIDQVVEGCALVAGNPALAPSCSHIRPGYLRILIGRHHVYFRETSYGIAVIRILHFRMDAPRRL